LALLLRLLLVHCLLYLRMLTLSWLLYLRLLRRSRDNASSHSPRAWGWL
jgi:hypothetical protein